jgi:hypothetical protein
MLSFLKSLVILTLITSVNAYASCPVSESSVKAFCNDLAYQRSTDECLRLAKDNEFNECALGICRREFDEDEADLECLDAISNKFYTDQELKSCYYKSGSRVIECFLTSGINSTQRRIQESAERFGRQLGELIAEKTSFKLEDFPYLTDEAEKIAIRQALQHSETRTKQSSYIKVRNGEIAFDQAAKESGVQQAKDYASKAAPAKTGAEVFNLAIQNIIKEKPLTQKSIKMSELETIQSLPIGSDSDLFSQQKTVAGEYITNIPLPKILGNNPPIMLPENVRNTISLPEAPKIDHRDNPCALSDHDCISIFEESYKQGFETQIVIRRKSEYARIFNEKSKEIYASIPPYADQVDVSEDIKKASIDLGYLDAIDAALEKEKKLATDAALVEFNELRAKNYAIRVTGFGHFLRADPSLYTGLDTMLGVKIVNQGGVPTPHGGFRVRVAKVIGYEEVNLQHINLPTLVNGEELTIRDVYKMRATSMLADEGKHKFRIYLERYTDERNFVAVQTATYDLEAKKPLEVVEFKPQTPYGLFQKTLVDVKLKNNTSTAMKDYTLDFEFKPQNVLVQNGKGLLIENLEPGETFATTIEVTPTMWVAAFRPTPLSVSIKNERNSLIAQTSYPAEIKVYRPIELFVKINGFDRSGETEIRNRQGSLRNTSLNYSVFIKCNEDIVPADNYSYSSTRSDDGVFSGIIGSTISHCNKGEQRLITSGVFKYQRRPGVVFDFPQGYVITNSFFIKQLGNPVQGVAIYLRYE